MLSKSLNQVVQKVGSGKDEVNIEVVKKLDSSLLNIIESDKKEEFHNENEKAKIDEIQISRNNVINDSKDIRNVEKNTPRRSSRLVKGNVRREVKPTIGKEIKNEKGYCNIDIKDKKIVNITDNRKHIINKKLQLGHGSDNDNGKKSSNHLTTTDKSISKNSELNESKVVSVEGQEENELTFEKEKGKEQEKEKEKGKVGKNQIIENSIDSNSDSEKDRSGDWWRDEVEITDQAPTSPPPLHRSSPSYLTSTPLLRTPVTQTVVRSKRTSSLSMSGESFNSDATTASITPVIHRVPRTQEDFNTNREESEKANRSRSVDNVKVKNDEVSELSDINDKHKKDYVRSRDEEDEQEEGEEGEEEGEDKVDEKKVRFQSADRSTSVIQNDKDDDDFSNFFISTFSSSVNSSDNEKS